MIKTLLLACGLILALSGCSFEVEPANNYVLFAAPGAGSGSPVDENEFGKVEDFSEMELECRGPDGDWKSGRKQPTLNQAGDLLSVMFEVPKLWVGRTYNFRVYGYETSKQPKLLGELKNYKVGTNTNFIEVPYKD